MPETKTVVLRKCHYVGILEARMDGHNPFACPAEEINTEDEALGAVLEYAECYAVSFDELLHDWRTEPTHEKEPKRIIRIKEVLQNARKAT